MTNNNLKSSITQISIVIIILVILYIWGNERSNYVKKNGIYNILTVDRIKVADSGGKNVGFHYKYRNIIYNSTTTFNYEDVGFKEKGKRFFMMIVPQNPKRILVLDSVPSWFTIDPPDEGWKMLPTEAEMHKWQNVADSLKM